MSQVEQHTPREVIEARTATEKALQDLETGWRRAQDVIGKRGWDTQMS
jgi:hypothetical protein